jgi:hypothetical protein
MERQTKESASVDEIGGLIKGSNRAMSVLQYIGVLAATCDLSQPPSPRPMFLPGAVGRLEELDGENENEDNEAEEMDRRTPPASTMACLVSPEVHGVSGGSRDVRKGLQECGASMGREGKGDALREDIPPGTFALPTQIIDRTRGVRPATFFESTTVRPHAEWRAKPKRSMSTSTGSSRSKDPGYFAGACTHPWFNSCTGHSTGTLVCRPRAEPYAHPVRTDGVDDSLEHEARTILQGIGVRSEFVGEWREERR